MSGRKRPRLLEAAASQGQNAPPPGREKATEDDSVQELALVPADYNPVYPYVPPGANGPPASGTVPPYYSGQDFVQTHPYVFSLRLQNPLHSSTNGVGIRLGTALHVESSGALGVKLGNGLGVDSSGSIAVKSGNGLSTPLFAWTGVTVRNVLVSNNEYINGRLCLERVGGLVYATVSTETATVKRNYFRWRVRFLSNGKVDTANSDLKGSFGWVTADGRGASYDQNPNGLDPRKMLPNRGIYGSTINTATQPIVMKYRIWNGAVPGVEGTIYITLNTLTDSTHPWSFSIEYQTPNTSTLQYPPITFSYFGE